MLNSAPCLSLRLAACTQPPSCFTMVSTICSPRPLELLLEPVVTCGRNRCSSISGAMPEPSSRTTISTWSAGSAGQDLNRAAGGHGVHGVQEKIDQHPLPGPVSAELNSGFHIARKADLRSASGSHGILDEGDGVGQDLFEGRARALARLEAGGDILAPLDAAQNRGGELGVARVTRQQVGRVHQCLEHVIEVVHQTGESQVFASLHD